ncbi:MAG: glucosamine-6-phosphate deaminase [Candidatus Hydrogenedentes bacterium]|nr:glucosamine-6-phosphate deaminase [Candidatus Hydrogenedentota bacterium]
MEVIIRETKADAVSLAAAIIARALRARPNLVLGLATGRTMEAVYELLVRLYEDDGLDFSLARTFNLDEYVGLPPEDPGSYRFYMNKHLFHRVNIDLRNAHLPNGMADDLNAECANYERLIKDCNGIDLQLLGIGRTGHIGFNEPLSAMRSRTRTKALAPETIEQNCPFFKGEPPRRAITMGVGTILECRRCLLLATGAEKADVIAKAVEGPVTAMISASALQLHPKCTVIVDEAAASRLEHGHYYRWVFENEPEWQEYH